MTIKETAKRLGVSVSTLTRHRRNPEYPRSAGIRKQRAWISAYKTGRGRPANSDGDGAAADPPAAAAAVRSLELRQRKMEAECAKLEAQSIAGREKLIGELFEELRDEGRRMLQPLREEIKKCRLPAKHARALNKAINRCLSNLG